MNSFLTNHHNSRAYAILFTWIKVITLFDYCGIDIQPVKFGTPNAPQFDIDPYKVSGDNQTYIISEPCCQLTYYCQCQVYRPAVGCSLLCGLVAVGCSLLCGQVAVGCSLLCGQVADGCSLLCGCWLLTAVWPGGCWRLTAVWPGGCWLLTALWPGGC